MAIRKTNLVVLAGFLLLLPGLLMLGTSREQPRTSLLAHRFHRRKLILMESILTAARPQAFTVKRHYRLVALRRMLLAYSICMAMCWNGARMIGMIITMALPPMVRLGQMRVEARTGSFGAAVGRVAPGPAGRRLAPTSRSAITISGSVSRERNAWRFYPLCANRAINDVKRSANEHSAQRNQALSNARRPLSFQGMGGATER